LEEYSLADVFREIHILACLGQFSANSAQTAKIYFSSPVGDLRNAAWGENLAPRFTFSQITGEGRLKKNTEKK
jgi:hypothetical protein